MNSPSTAYPPSSGTMFGSRRDFLRAAAVGGAAVAIPSILASCKVGETMNGTTTTGGGPALTIDFSKADTAYLQFLSVFKQLQTDFYTNIVAVFSSSDLTAAQQALVTEIKNHEVIHRETIKAVLGSANAVSITPKWGTTNFRKAADILQIGINFEDVSIGLFNGLVQHLISSPNISLALEMQSVEGRHSASLRDLQLPKSGTPTGYSPGTADASYPLTVVAAQIQGLIVESLQFTNAPAGL